MLLYLKALISDRANLSAVLKIAILEDITECTVNEKKCKIKVSAGFEWLSKHKDAFKKCKKAIIKNVISEEDEHQQCYLITDASLTEAERWLFQLLNHLSDILISEVS